jgi:hypothetical protein
MHIRYFVADLRRSIDRWQSEADKADAAGCPMIGDIVRTWIAEANRVIADSGYATRN